MCQFDNGFVDGLAEFLVILLGVEHLFNRQTAFLTVKSTQKF